MWPISQIATEMLTAELDELFLSFIYIHDIELVHTACRACEIAQLITLDSLSPHLSSSSIYSLSLLELCIAPSIILARMAGRR